MSSEKCNIENCDLNTYENNNECILHCVKKTDSSHYSDFLEERDEFFSKLASYIVTHCTEIQDSKKGKVKNNPFNVHPYHSLSNNLERCDYFINNKINFKYVALKDIHFPRPDYKGSCYVSLLNRIRQIDFHDCYFYDTGLELEGEVFFQKCTFCNSWSLFDYQILENVEDVIYSHCVFEKAVEFKPKESKDGKNKNLSNSQFNYFCKFKDQLTINEAIIKKPIFNDEQGNFGKNNFAKKMSFNDCKFKENQEFYITPDNIETECLFNKCNFDKKLKIRSVEKGKYEDQQENKAELKSLKFIDCTANGDNVYLRVGFLAIDEFVLSNLRLPQNAEFNIGDCHFKNFKLTNFRNIGKFKLYKINVLSKEKDKKISYNPKFQIDNTSIGKTDFQSVNLNSFEKVKMFDNIFTEIDYTNVQWKRKIEVGQFGKIDKVKIAKQRDTYRTLKNVMIRNNDQQEALVFYQKEIEKHWEITKQSKEFSNKITLAFNKYTNNFGLNWWLPICWRIVLAILFYIILLYLLPISDSYLLPISDFSVNSLDDWSKFFARFDWSKFFARFFIFLNPTHKVGDVFGGDWNGLAYAIDFIFRIIEGSLVYQTIQAFRKYSRKL